MDKVWGPTGPSRMARCASTSRASVFAVSARSSAPDLGREARRCDDLGLEAIGIVLARWTARDQPWSTRAGTGACPYGWVAFATVSA
jgi:hypothetical protein